MDPEHYKTIPALAAYIDRIGAEQLNFRRFMVREFKGNYYVEKSLISIGSDCSITCTNEIHEPTEDEVADIMAQLAMVQFPKSILATDAQFKQLKRKLKGSTLYEFYSRNDDGIIMVQSRIDQDGKKQYVPWTYWSDGKWRAMEPDGALPFWKPKEKTHDRIMIHEGAKSADAAANVKPSHPWFDELDAYEHWGMIGGALAPHRADYDELKREQPAEVIYVCDNDWPGFNALQKVSKSWGRTLKGIRFNDDFPLSWDMADEMPENLFKGDNVWAGPTLKQLARPATQATVRVKVEGSKKKVAILTEDFKKEWKHTVTPEFFVHCDWPARVWGADEFNSIVAPFSHIQNTAGLLKKEDGAKIASIEYNPSCVAGLYHSDAEDMEVMNTYLPINIEPLDEDASIWLEYMKRLFPFKQDRLEVMRWCATLIARPDIRMPYSLLLISNTHGVGKTTLGEKILAPIIGMPNCSFPSEKDVSNSSFNTWLARKRLIIVNEIYSGHSLKTYNTLKQIVSDKVVEVNEKFVKGYTIQNWAHVIASSNSFRALRIEEADRRWLIPKCSEKVEPHEYWVRLHRWIDTQNGLRVIIHWAHEFLKENDPVFEGVHSPMTEAKREIIDDGFSPANLIVRRVIDDLNNLGKDWWILDTDLVKIVKQELYGGSHNQMLEKPLTLRKMAEKLEVVVGKKNNGCTQIKLPAATSRVLSNSRQIASTTPAKLIETGIMPNDINALMDF